MPSVVEHEGDVVAVALMHDRPIGFWPNFFAGGYQLFRYGTPRLFMNLSDAAASAISTALDAGDFDWYLETLSVDRRMRGRGVGRWLVAKVLPDFVAKRGGRAYGFVTSTESNARFYLNGGCELLDRGSTSLRGRPVRSGPFRRKRSCSECAKVSQYSRRCLSPRRAVAHDLFAQVAARDARPLVPFDFKDLRSFRVKSWQEQAPGARTLLRR